jgi:aminodeoxyfutalosine deaminase
VDAHGTVCSLGPWDGRWEGERIDWEGLVFPGLVNAHVHLELSALKGRVPRGLGVTPWVEALQPSRAGLSPDEIAHGIVAALGEMETDGTVACADVGNDGLSLPHLSAGRLRSVYFFEVLGFLRDAAESIFQQAQERLARYRREFPGVSCFLAPHALYSTSENLVRMLWSVDPEGPSSIHLAEGSEECALLEKGEGPWKRYLQGLGKWPSQWQCPGVSPMGYLKRLHSQKRIILVHLVHLTEEEMTWLKDHRNLFPCVCLRSNLYVSNQAASLDRLWKAGCTLALGTDSLASNESLSLQAEMKTAKRLFPSLPNGEILRMATLHGAQALGMDKEFGSFAPGKRPGVLLAAAESLDAFLGTPGHIPVRRVA